MQRRTSFYTTVVAHAGLPDIEVLCTSDEAEAAEFIRGWQGTYHFGLDMEWRPVYQKGAPPARSALLQISAGPWVLIFDLVPLRNKWAAQPLPDALWAFIENENHTFYGMGLLEDLSRLAFEFDCVANGIDFVLRAWPQHIQLGGGLAGLANRVLGTTVRQSKKITMSNWDKRPLSAEQLNYLAEDAYLSWAVAQHMMEKSPVNADWVISMAELYGRGKSFIEHGLAVQEPWHDWSDAARQHEDFQRAKQDKQKKKKKEEKKKVNGAEGAAEDKDESQGPEDDKAKV